MQSESMEKDGEVAVVKITKHGKENDENTEMQMLKGDAVKKITERLDTLDYRENTNVVCSVDGHRTNWRPGPRRRGGYQSTYRRGNGYGYFTKERRDREIRCYSCGREGHIARECTQRIERQSRCYNCGSFGHGVRSCPKPPTGNPLN